MMWQFVGNYNKLMRLVKGFLWYIDILEGNRCVYVDNNIGKNEYLVRNMLVSYQGKGVSYVYSSILNLSNHYVFLYAMFQEYPNPNYKWKQNTMILEDERKKWYKKASCNNWKYNPFQDCHKKAWLCSFM